MTSKEDREREEKEIRRLEGLRKLSDVLRGKMELEVARRHEALSKKSVVERELISEQLNNRPEIGSLVAYNERVSQISRDELRIHFLPDLVVMERCIGDELCRSIHSGDMDQPRIEEHTEISLYIALRTIESLNGSPDGVNAWTGFEKSSQAPGAPSEALMRLEWLKTAFRCALSMPIGFLVSQTALKSDSNFAPPWSPCFEDLPDYVKKHGPSMVRRSKRILSGRAISFSTHRRIFGPVNGQVPGLSLAEADFFADRPSNDNPLAVAFNDAISHVFHDRFHLRLPFWWALVINDHFRHRPDFKPIGCYLTATAAKAYRVAAKADEADAEKAPVHPEVESALSESNPAEPPEKTAGQEAHYASKQKALVRPTDDGASVLSESQPEVSEPDPALIRQIVEVTRNALATDDFTVNVGGSVFQRVSGAMHIVVPLFFARVSTRLQSLAASDTEIHQAMLDSQLLDADSLDSPEAVFEIFNQAKRRRLGKCRTLRLTELGVRLFFPSGATAEDNPDLRPLQSGVDQENAA